MSKSTVRLDEDDKESDDELPVEKQSFKPPQPSEKSDADLDREELERVRQKFNAKKLAKTDKKKAPVLDADDDDDEDQQKDASAPRSFVSTVVSC